MIDQFIVEHDRNKSEAITRGDKYGLKNPTKSRNQKSKHRIQKSKENLKAANQVGEFRNEFKPELADLN